MDSSTGSSMLELWQPLPMPHTVSSENAVASLPSWTDGKRVPRHLSLRLAKPSVDEVLQTFCPSDIPISRGPPTPPSEMNGSMLGQRAGLDRYGLRSLGATMQLTSMPHPSTSVPHGLVHSRTNSVSAISPLSKRSTTTQSEAGQNSPASTDASNSTLRLPNTIRAPQETIPQLAAEITCLFWFENGATLKRIENMSARPSSPLSLVPESTPTLGFRKWVTNLLSTTQVTQNVILLALLFIYRLKSANPGVKGKLGSEYRLLTVALMLGNKFLDDNTYTNKTWAEVSGIAVQEVHVMEVEFLSNMRYSLFTSKSEWMEWHSKLGTFGTFIHRAARALEAASRMTNINGTSVHIPAALPSPPTSQNASPPFLANHSPPQLCHSQTPLLLPQISSTVVSPIGPLPELDFRNVARKRPYEEDTREQPAKRHMPNFTYQLPMLSTTGAVSHPPAATHLPRMTLPSLTIPHPINGQTPVQITPQLPPPGSRAMSLVYPIPQQRPQPTSQPTSIPPIQTSFQPSSQGSNLSDLSRQLSPYTVSANSSPVSASLHNHLSPSYFLAQRASPYRPVRRVQTLLVPPPTSSVYNAPKLVGLEQMQYHPLGKPLNERRVGHLPYINHDTWPQTLQFNQYSELQQSNEQIYQH